MKPISTGGFGESRVIAWGLAISIAVLFTLSASSLAGVIKTQPQYDQFCKPEITNKGFENEKSCTENGGKWNGSVEPIPTGGKTAPAGYCDTTYQCNTEYQSAQKSFGQTAFVIYALLGGIAIIAGMRFGQSFPVVTGLILGGISTSIVGAIKYFEYTPPIIRTMLLVLICILLVWIGIRKFQHTTK